MITIRALLILLGIMLLAGVASAQAPVNRAGVVVRFGNGEVVTACVTFSESSISGLELLERSGLPVIAQQSSLGAAICKIGREGCDYPATSCFCARDQGRAVYWAFYVRDAGAWRYSNLGAGNVRVSDGDLHGWAWGPGDPTSGAVPPDREFASVCDPVTDLPTATATSVPTATATSAPTVTATSVPTVTATSAATATATSVPTATATSAATATTSSSAVADPSATAPAGTVQWLGFVALVALLIGGIVVTARRRQ